MSITDPRDISGLVAWYSAEYESRNYADGAQMTTWTDLSGSANHATGAGATKPLWQATTGPGSAPAVRFQGTGYFTLPSGLVSGWTAGEVFYVTKSDGSDCGFHGFGTDSGASDESHYPFSGTVYESFGGATGNRQSFSPSVSISSTYRRYNVTKTSTQRQVWLDSTSQVGPTNITNGWMTGSPTIGMGRKSSAVDLAYIGRDGLFLLYSRSLTTGERSDLNTWATAHPNGGTIPLGGPIGTATETDTAIPLGRTKTKAIGTATETDTALPITHAAILLGTATETDTAIPLARKKTRALGTATETDSAPAIVASKRKAIGTATETDTPGAVAVTIAVTTVVTDASVSGRRRRIGTAMVESVPPTGSRIGPIRRTSLTFAAPTLVNGRPV